VRRRLVVGALAILIIAGLYFFAGHRARPRITAQGQPAPDFSLQQLNGHPLRLADYHGKVVLLDFWATWCVPCREETPHLVELQKKYGAQGLQIIGVSMDDGPEPVREFSQHFQINYPVVMGNADIGRLYGGILGLPIVFVIDPAGRIYKKHIGATAAGVLEDDVKTLLQSS
jgi:cytochrome c biogenesis protein CcmG/thiol:disulfide interchange protein DsbE